MLSRRETLRFRMTCSLTNGSIPTRQCSPGCNTVPFSAHQKRHTCRRLWRRLPCLHHLSWTARQHEVTPAQPCRNTASVATAKPCSALIKWAWLQRATKWRFLVRCRCLRVITRKHLWMCMEGFPFILRCFDWLFPPFPCLSKWCRCGASTSLRQAALRARHLYEPPRWPSTNCRPLPIRNHRRSKQQSEGSVLYTHFLQTMIVSPSF